MDEQRVLAGRYVLRRAVGRGAMGQVWLAEDQLLKRPVAVKQVAVDDPNSSCRMAREAQTAARLCHAGAVKVFDLVIEDERPYLVMEFVWGPTLAQLIGTRGRLPGREVAALLAPVAEALARAHRAGIIHRDIKPSNILITSDDAAKLADFGVARYLADATITANGGLIGTPGYLPPEAAHGADPSPAGDIFSFGATIYTALQGEPPYGRHHDPVALLGRMLNSAPRYPEFAGRLEPILRACLDLDPSRRPTARQLAQALTQAAAATPDSAVVRPLARARRRRWSQGEMAGTAAAAVVAAAVIAFALLPSGRPDSTSLPTAAAVPAASCPSVQL